MYLIPGVRFSKLVASFKWNLKPKNVEFVTSKAMYIFKADVYVIEELRVGNNNCNNRILHIYDNKVLHHKSILKLQES